MTTFASFRRFACAGSIALSAWCATANVFGDDLNPPSYRGLPRSTSAEWDFLTEQPNNNIQPDGTSVPLVQGDFAPQLDAAFVGDPHPSGSRFGGTTVAWTSAISNGGYLATGTSTGIRGLAFNVPNWIDQEPLKQLRIQVTYQGPAPTTDVVGFLGVPGASDNVAETFVGRVTATSPNLPAGMSYFYDDWECRPNPDWEQVILYVSEGTFIDQVVIDSVSWVPEPTSGVLGIGGAVALGLVRRRVRRSEEASR
jgi:hypothetical protein